MSAPEQSDLRELISDLQARVTALERQAAVGMPKLPAARSTPESRFGLAAVNRIGAVTLAIGIIFFFKYAADNQWIGPTARVLIGLFSGTVLIGSSEWLSRHGQRVFSQGLAGCGLASLYISLYAAFGFYRLIGAGVAFGLLLLLCAGMVALALHRSNSATAMLGLIGALLTPLLIELTGPQSWLITLAIYLFCLDATALVLARWRRWELLISLTAAMVAVTALIRISNHVAPFVMLMGSLALAHFAISLGRDRTADRLSLNAYVVAHAFAVLAGLRLITGWTPSGAVTTTIASVFLALYGTVLLSVGLAQGTRTNRGLGLVFLGFVVAKLYLYDIWQLAYAARIVAFVVLGILLLLASFIYARSRSDDVPSKSKPM